MKTNFIFERFEDYLSSQYTQINEAEGNETGFLAILGSTDAENLGAVVAPKIGIKPDTTYTLTINGEKDLISLGKSKTYSKFSGLKESGKSNPKEDYIFIKTPKSSGEIKAGVSAKGNTIVDFDKDGVIEVKASNNGLLAFLRACSSMEKACEGKDSFSDKPWSGKMIISMGNPPSGDDSRNSSYLAVNPNVSGLSNVRTTKFDSTIEKGNDKSMLGKYITESEKSEFWATILEADAPKSEAAKEEAIKVIGDSIADAIRAAQYYHAKGRICVNNFGVYGGYRTAHSKYRKTLGTEEWEKASRLNKSSFILAVLLQHIIRSLGYFYPMSEKFQDLVPGSKEILESLGGKEESAKTKNLGKARDILKGMLSLYKPEKYEKIPAFDPVLDGFWKALVNALASRTAMTFNANVDTPAIEQKEGEEVKAEGKEKSGKKKNVSGGV